MQKATKPGILARIAGGAWGIWFFLVIALLFFLLYPLFLIALSFEKTYPLAHFGRKIWGSILFLLSGMWLRLKYVGSFDRRKTYVIVANHASYLDIPCLTLGIPGFFIFMAKAELARIPLFGRFFKTMDIAVERKDAAKSKASFNEAIRRLKNGTSVMMFPEGTIGEQVPELGEFKDGPFMAAVIAGADILPVTLFNNWKHLPDGRIFSKPGILRMKVHRPIPTAGLKLRDARDLKQKVFSIIESDLKNPQEAWK